MIHHRYWTLLACFAVVVCARAAAAHPIGVSRGEYRSTPEGVAVSLAFAETELTALRDATGAGTVEDAVLGRLRVQAAGEPCPGRVHRTEKVPPDGLALELTFTCESGGSPREVELRALFDALARGHRHEAVAPPSEPRLLFEDRSRFELPAPGTIGRVPAPETARRSTFLDFVHMGVEHILAGFDHLVFLLGLVVVGLERRRVLGIVTAFTLAHSLTLAIAVLGVWAPSGALVEPLIALSVAYVGVENFVSRRFERRTLLAFAFGLIHGFGFAGALGEVRFESAASSLLAFNVGVELGQLAVLAVLLPLIAMVRRSPSLERSVVPAVNTVVVLLGVGWFVLRVA